jgi:HD-like signal output (HDOD) protein
MLNATTLQPPAAPKPYPEAEIRRRIEATPKLASLQSINQALSALIRSDSSLNSQIAEIIRKDPSLSTRILRMVNSVYFGLSARLNNIEEAVFFLGLRQIRELSLATPVIEEMEGFKLNASLPWKELWKHSIGTAILTREIIASTPLRVDDDTDYLVGLLHNIGKVVMAYAFPNELVELMSRRAATPAELCAHEREVIGWDHAQIGAYYLECHRLADEIVMAVRYHADPEAAPRHRLFAAALQVGDSLVRFSGIHGGFELLPPVANESWLELDGWKILYGADGAESMLARGQITNSLRHLPSLMQGLL